MMDPLTALSIAAAVAQFVDYGTRVLKDTRELIKSAHGQTAQNIELRTIAQDISTFVHDIDSRSQSLATGYLAPSEEVFLRLCYECRDLADELQASIKKLQARGTTRLEYAANSFAVAVRGIWNTAKLKGLLKKLDHIRQQMMMAVLTFLWGEAKSRSETISQLAQRQVVMMGAVHRLDQSTRKYGQEVADLVHCATRKDRNQAREMIDYILNSNTGQDELIRDVLPASGSRPDLSDDQKHIRTIINSLSFDAIDDREGAIPEAYMKTYEWIFRDPCRSVGNAEVWSSFPRWLEGPSDDIYWITGKPGAGKSTLTKFILGDSRLKTSLLKWANGDPLLVAGYFSWNSGEQLQKSHAGLIRSLLYQCLRSQPQLVPLVASRRWAAMNIFSDYVATDRDRLPQWSDQELWEAFRQLVFKCSRGLKIVFIIDGLDEFNEDHSRLVTMLQEINRKGNVKICVSSRPWNVFRDALNQNPKLCLEDLTKRDIDLYVEGKFAKSEAFRELKILHPEHANKLFFEITNKAQGVFLWVSVVVRSLLESLQEGDQLPDLLDTVAHLPQDISQLFDIIWTRIDPKYHCEASKYFQMMAAAEELGMVVHSLCLYMAGDDVPPTFGTGNLSGPFISNVTLIVRRRLNSRTKDLLEILTDDNGHRVRVEYLHRTVKEWVATRWDNLLTQTQNFDPFFALLKGEVSRMAVDDFTFERKIFNRQVRLVLKCACEVKQSPGVERPFMEILDKLDRHLTMVSQITDYNGYYLLFPALKQASKSRQAQRRITPHWCNARKLGISMYGRPTNYKFIDLLAMMSLNAVIKLKMVVNPDMLIAEEDLMRFLRSIIYGGLSTGYEKDFLDIQHPMEPRLELLEFAMRQIERERLPEINASLQSEIQQKIDTSPFQDQVYLERVLFVLNPKSSSSRGIWKKLKHILLCGTKHHHARQARQPKQQVSSQSSSEIVSTKS
ncbi:hypothetical protein BX600DRAFT_112802 [Xylariales sp. PMI_506]|nr:hypothetical protein BX600DRAFT_112802 [Xylariales sp. PMI_506]